MNYKLFLIIGFFLLNFNLLAKKEFLVCDNYKFKISIPIIGFDKIYIKKNTTWHKVSSFKISEKEIIIYNLGVIQEKCSNEDCTINFIISKNSVEKNFLDYRSIASNDKCEIDGSEICFKRPIGKSLSKGYCSKVNNID